MSGLLQLVAGGLSRDGHTLLADIDLQLRAGCLLAVLGPNGAGKSSLLSLLSAEQAPSRGQRIVTAPELRESNPSRARHMAVLPQLDTLSFPYTAREVIQLGRMPHATGAARDAAITEELLGAFDLLPLADQLYTVLSGGERKRVQLARVLAQLWQVEGPRLLLLDEPSAALDLRHQQALMALLGRLRDAGMSVVVVLHDLNLAAAHADELILLDQGRCVAQGAVADVMQLEILQPVFGLALHSYVEPASGRQRIFPQ